MIVYQIGNFSHFDSFTNSKILFLSKIEQFQKFDYFMNLSIIKI